MSIAMLHGDRNNQLFKKIVDRSITEVTAEDLAGISVIDKYAFFWCRNLRSIPIPDSVIDIQQHAISYCTSLQSIFIPDSVAYIGAYAFAGDRDKPMSATDLILGRGVTRIGEFAFYYCSNVSSITIKATTPPTLVHANAFDGTNNCSIYVPAQSVNAYKSATNWSGIASRIHGYGK